MKLYYFFLLALILFFSCSEDSDKGVIGDSNLKCELTYPYDNLSFTSGEKIQLEAAVSGPTHIVVDFYANDVKIGSDNTAPYDYIWDTNGYPSGSYELKCIAISGNEQKESTLKNISLKIFAISEPSEGQSFIYGSNVSIKATLSSTKSTSLNKVSFYVDNQLIGEDSSSPYSYNWNTDGYDLKDYTIKAIGTLDNSNEIEDSVSVFLKSFIISSPVQNQNFIIGEQIEVNTIIEAEKSSPIDSIRIFFDNNYLFTKKTAPFNFIITTEDYQAGSHELKLQAYTTSGSIFNESVDINLKSFGIDSPANNGEVFIGESVVISTMSSKSDEVSKVDFYVNNELVGTDNSVPFSYTWETSGNEIGTYIIKAEGFLGNTFVNSSTINLIINDFDLIKPVEENSYLTGEDIAIEAQFGSSPVNDLNMKLYIDSELLTEITTSPYTYTFNSTNYSGVHVVKADLISGSGNIITKSKTISVRNFAITSPSQNSTILKGELIPVSAELSNKSKDITEVKFYLNDQLINTVLSSPYAFDMNTSELPEGNYTLIAKANTELGGKDIIESSVSFDIKKLELTSPEENYIALVDEKVNIDIADLGATSVGTIKYYINNEEIASFTNAPYSYDWDTASDAPGTKYVKVTAFTNYGNEISDSRAIELHGFNITSPVDDDNIFKGEEIVIKAEHFMEDKNVSEVSFYIDGTLAETDTEAPYEYNWQTNGLSLKDYEIKAIAFTNSDKLTSRKSEKIAKKSKDQIESIISISLKEFSIVEPVGNDLLLNGEQVEIITNLESRSVSSVNFYVDENLSGTVNQYPFNYTLNTSGITDGNHVIKAELLTSYGNSVYSEINVTLLHFKITQPAENEIIPNGELVTIKAETLNQAKGISNVNFFVDDVLIGSSNSIPYQINWNTSGVNPGSHIIKAVATTSHSGKAEVASQVNILITGYGFIRPSNGDVIIKGETINVETDIITGTKEITTVKYYIDEVYVGEDNSSPYNYSWNTTSYSVGSHNLKAVAETTSGDPLVQEVDVNIKDMVFLSPASSGLQFMTGENISVYVNFNGAKDEKSVSNLKFYLNGSLIQTFENPTNGAGFNINTQTLQPMNYNLEAVAETSFGNNVTKTIDFILSSCTLEIVSPVNNAHYLTNHTVEIELDYDAQNYYSDGVELYIDNVLMTTLTSAPFVYNWNTVPNDNGVRTIKVVSESQYGKVVQKQVSIVLELFDMNFTEPQNSEIIPRGEVRDIIVSVNDPLNRIDNLKYYLDGTLKETLSHNGTSTYTFQQWDTSLSSLGNHTLEVKCYNSVGEVISKAIMVSLEIIENTASFVYGDTNSEIEPKYFAQTDDQGYIMAYFDHNDQKVYVKKLDAFFNEVTNIPFENLNGMTVNSMLATNYGGYLLCGYTYDNGVKNSKVVKIYNANNSSEWSIEWEKSFGTSGNDQLLSAQQKYNNGFVIVGSIEEADSINVRTINLFSNGNVSSDITFQKKGSQVLYDIKQKSNDTFVASGYYDEGNGNKEFYVVEFNQEGQFSKEYYIGESSGVMDEIAYSVTEKGNSYTVAGSVQSTNGLDAWVVSVSKPLPNPGASPLWEVTINQQAGTYNDIAYSQVNTSDNGSIMGGYTDAYGTKDLWLVKLNSSFYPDWKKTYSYNSQTNTDDEAKFVVQTSDGGFALLGTSGPAGSDKKKLWFLKLNEEGVLSK
ncbi:MAG: hypothetical protein JXR48_10670 [Candidatus Delongbacteria bacterium]|nr:hypothetical protein [Candidatus Delongbacteria bacterium]MBN2835415.1 hypothetical protein [Candidatus Delongbacteria bacterium]